VTIVASHPISANALPASIPASTAPANREDGNVVWMLGLERKWWVMAVAMSSVILAEAAFTVLILQTTQVQQSIDSDTFAYQWATLPYMVCMVVCALVSSRFARTYGSQRTFLVSAWITGAACLLASAAQSLAFMVFARTFMAAKAILLAVALSQLWLAFPQRKGIATSAYTGAMFGGLFGGAALGGILDFHASWRSSYLIAGLGFLVLALAGHWTLIHDRPSQPPALKLNSVEALLLAAFVGATLFLLLRGQHSGWFDSNLIVFLLLFAAVTFVLFLWTAATSPEPLVSLQLARFPTLALTLTVIGLFSATVIGQILTLPSYLNLRGYPSGVDGWILSAPTVAIGAACSAAAFVYRRTPTVLLLWLGLLIAVLGSLWFMDANLYTSKYTIVAMLCLWGIGVGLVLPTAMRLTFAGQDQAAVQRLAGVKVALRFGATILGAFAASLIIQRAADTSQDVLRQHVTPSNAAYRPILERVRQYAISRGSDPATAAEQAGSMVSAWVARNAQMSGQRAGRRYFVILAVAALLVALCIRLRSEQTIFASDRGVSDSAAANPEAGQP
jgi:MFS transporter, DHA2 family, multidrug resistance protein